MILGVTSIAKLISVLRSDYAANPNDPKSRLILTGFRLCQYLMRDSSRPRPISFPVVAAYRFWTEFCLGMELRPKTFVGPGLTIYHGYALVINDHAVIGSCVVLRNGVVIGQKHPGGGSPILQDGVTVGAGAIILGSVTIGKDAVIGAGAIVVRDVAEGDIVAGNPARSVRRPDRAESGQPTNAEI